MKEFLGHALFNYGRHIEAIGALYGLQPAARLTDDQCQQLVALLNRVDKGAEYLELAVSKQACKELLSILEKKDSKPSAATLQPLLVELNKRIEVELKAHMYLCVCKEQSQFYNKPFENWDTAETAFPKVTYDIEEASKCVALRRNTGGRVPPDESNGRRCDGFREELKGADLRCLSQSNLGQHLAQMRARAAERVQRHVSGLAI